MMKKHTVILLAVVLGLCTGVIGCKKRPVGITPLPGRAGVGGMGSELPSAMTDDGGIGIGTLPLGDEGGISQEDNPDRSGWPVDRNTFAEQTVYFDFDKATVNPSEIGKLETVVSRMGSFPRAALRIAGHCDERGTEEYNRALGERRALAVRETLVGLGMSPSSIETVSYGEDQPVAFGHDQASWAKNRRGEVLLLTPPGANP